MKKIKMLLIIILLAAVIYWLWTGNDDFLPYTSAAAGIALPGSKETGKTQI